METHAFTQAEITQLVRKAGFVTGTIDYPGCSGPFARPLVGDNCFFELAQLVQLTAAALVAIEQEGGERTSLVLMDILTERRRQIEVKGWTPEHDDQHEIGQLAIAAACYAANAGGFDWVGGWPGEVWPWASQWWKPSTPRRDLVKAAALIIAEIERLDRADKTAAATIHPIVSATEAESIRSALKQMEPEAYRPPYNMKGGAA